MITMDTFWTHGDIRRDIVYADELTETIKLNAQLTVERVNELLEAANLQHLDTVNSGWRPQSVNDATRNAAKNSRHLVGQAVDIADPGRMLARWCWHNPGELQRIGLWMEHPGWTPTWVHLQTVSPGSGVRIYIPSTAPQRDLAFEGRPVRDGSVA